MRRQKYPIKTVRVDKLIRIGRYEKEERQVWILDCPQQCGETIRLVEFGDIYKKCGCGFTWHIELFALGVKDTSERKKKHG